MKVDTLGEAFCSGIVDRHEYGLLRAEQLYRTSKKNRMAWRLGYELANLLTQRPFRTAKRSTPKEARS